MTDSLKLKAAIIAAGLSRRVVAEELGISLYSLQKKINNVTEFKASEISKLSRLLNIKNITEIFLCQQ